MGSAALRSGFKLFGLLDHVYDLVIASAAHCLFDTDLQSAFFQDCPSVHIGALALGHRQRFAGHGCLVYRSLAGCHMPVQRNNIAGVDHNVVTRLYIRDRNKDFLLVLCLHPYFIYVQAHAACQIVDRFFVGPLFQKSAGIQKEHDRICRRIVPSQNRHRDRRGIQYRHFHASLSETLQTGTYIPHRFTNTEQASDREGQDHHPYRPPDHHEKQSIFILPVQLPARMFGHIHFGPLIVKLGQCPDHGLADPLLFFIKDRHVHGALGNSHLIDAFLGLQIITQLVCLRDSHSPLDHPYAHPASGFM